MASARPARKGLGLANQGNRFRLTGRARSEKCDLGGFTELEPLMSKARRTVSLIDHFSALKDPARVGGSSIRCGKILLLVLCASLCGMEDFVEIRMAKNRDARCRDKADTCVILSR